MTKNQSKLDPETVNIVEKLHNQTKLLTWMVVLLIVTSVFVLAGLPLFHPSPSSSNAVAVSTSQDDYDDGDYEIIDGIEQSSGMKVDDHWELTKITCTPCHSAMLVTQNRASREGWEHMIRWMQETQGLWDLGENEPLILDYLAKNYGVSSDGKGANLIIEEWYEID